MRQILPSFFLAILLLSGNQLALAESEPLDLRILIDISREVKTAQPSAQYLDALHLFVTQLPENSRVGIWTYGKYVNYLVPQQRIDSSWHDNAISKIQSIRPVAANRNIGLVLRKASYDIKLEDQAPRSILLISAGGVSTDDEAGGNERESRRIKETLIPKLREAGYLIHTIALSKTADTGLLTTLAKETGGFSIILNQADDIYSALELLAQRIQQSNSTPIQDQQFAIDVGVTEFIALLRHEQGLTMSLQSPSGNDINQHNAATNNQVQWIQGKQFVLVKVSNPELGRWRLSDGFHEENRVFIRGTPLINLNKFQNDYFAGQNLELSVALQTLEGSSNPRVSVELTERESFNYELEAQPDSSGLYIGQINGFYQSGLYKIKVVAEALNYTRVLELPFQVHDLLTMHISKQQGENSDEYLVTIEPMDDDLDLNQSTIVATITDSTGEWTVSSVNLNDANQWELLIKDDGKSTEYQVKLDFKGVTQSGRQLHFQPKPLVITASRKDISTENKLIVPFHKSIGENTKKAPIQPHVETLEKGEKPLTLIIVAITSVSLGLLLLGLSFFKNYGKKEPLALSTQEAKTTKSVEAEDTLSSPEVVAILDPEIPVVEPAQVTALDEEGDTREKDSADIEIKLNLGDKSKRSEAPALSEPKEPAANSPDANDLDLALDDGSPSEIEIELDFNDEAIVEGTELAPEWSELDAKSNIEAPVKNAGVNHGEAEIEFEFDDDVINEAEKKSDSQDT
ncbi:MAG: VWA domain-containing protein [Pseudomonadales bacterium]|nr:VWA domain-containing protein [Pseudomonadales bacterium]MCP5214773.1 VWA domain-containing protein [Pseudomonadales bacterium]